MTELNLLFRKRVGLSFNEEITFDQLPSLLEKTAMTIPFENLCVIRNTSTELSIENLVHKILVKNEGGLCYDLNSILYLFLKENGMNIYLVRGVVYDHLNQRWSPVGKTHVANLISHENQFYIVDTGFGGNLPLRPVPLNGEVVTSKNGQFKVEKLKTEYGDYALYMKLKYKDDNWKLGYAFDSLEKIMNLADLNEVQKRIVEHPESPFNKKPLVTRLTETGNVTLTDSSFTEWVNGKVGKEEVDERRFNEIVKEIFDLRAY
ncbi:arylamine N-acetyltransferase [Bacillus sp. 31A1R]|uniref:Arylamine N-acetyltransferase n=1 Tax=Robertmurraya mangrovi TaxID=3098077 RepID=A0ABU5J0D2_9BACI|nr:arylamine N-acetyltransferase [Bacillus sp. 31A1R]MDZ5472874.1 arylamine N-acetyltransferase [Bacillus sp. 31A1R]